MTKVGAFEAKNTLGSLLDRVESGEVIVITRHGRPVARLVPDAEVVDRTVAEAAAARIRSRSRRLKLSFDWKELKEDRDAGRP